MVLLRRMLFALLLGLAVLEVALQVAAWLAVPAATTTGGSATAPILCIGDSYTYGLGATSTERSYPGVLEKLLTARLPGAIAVKNAGWAGQNSREALLRLDAQLDEHQPQLVCVLIGLNDSWTRPAIVTADELATGESAGFTWRWRTWRLMRLLFRDAPTQAPSTAPPTNIGTKPPNAATTGSHAIATEAVLLVRAGHPDRALALLERSIVEDPANAPEYHQGLVQIQTAIGQRGRATPSLRWLQDRYRTAPSEAVAEALAMSLHALGERKEAATLANEAVGAFPQSSTLWWIASQHHYDTGRLREAEQELDRAIATAAPDNPQWIAALHRDLARACCRRDLQKAVREMLAAMHIDRDVDRCRLIVDSAAEAFSERAIRDSLAAIVPSDADIELLQRLFGGGWADRSEMRRVLTANLQQILQRCQDRGLRVVLLGYPLDVADVAGIQQELATARSLPFVAMMPAFTAALQKRSREELYIRDGHCADAGYALMAETMLPTVLAALEK